MRVSLKIHVGPCWAGHKQLLLSTFRIEVDVGNVPIIKKLSSFNGSEAD